jgi:2,5-dioxopentanoate dehydrogenase
VGLTIVRHPLLAAVGFTGSLRAGRIFYDEGSARSVPIPVYAEMGSVNPIFLLPSALAARGDALLDGLVNSMLMGVGQFCTNPGLILGVAGPDFDALRERLAARIAKAQAGVMLHAGMRTSFLDAVYRVKKHGAELLAQGPPASGSEGFTVQPVLLSATSDTLLSDPLLQHEMFGPASILVSCTSTTDMVRVAAGLDGQLTATVHGTPEELSQQRALVQMLQRRAGRVLFNGYPTGVEFGHAIHHGGPYPASSDARTTSVGSAAIARFTRPVCFQGFPQDQLPEAIRDRNTLGLWRMINGTLTQDDVPSR